MRIGLSFGVGPLRVYVPLSDGRRSAPVQASPRLTASLIGIAFAVFTVAMLYMVGALWWVLGGLTLAAALLGAALLTRSVQDFRRSDKIYVQAKAEILASGAELSNPRTPKAIMDLARSRGCTF